MGGFPTHSGEHVGVCVESYRNGGVPQKFLDEFGVDVALEEQGGAGVPKIVEGDGGSPARSRSGANERWRRLEGLMRPPPSPAKTRP